MSASTDQPEVAGDKGVLEPGLEVLQYIETMVEGGIDEQMARVVCNRLTRGVDLSDRSAASAVGKFVETIIQHTDENHRLCLVR